MMVHKLLMVIIFLIWSQLMFAEEGCLEPSIIRISIYNDTYQNCALSSAIIKPGRLHRGTKVPILLQAGDPEKYFEIDDLPTYLRGPQVDVTYRCGHDKMIQLRSKVVDYPTTVLFAGSVLKSKHLYAGFEIDREDVFACPHRIYMSWVIFG